MSLLDFANKKRICRKYYGDDKKKKPEEECYWSDEAFCTGWYETDSSLRKRIIENK